MNFAHGLRIMCARCCKPVLRYEWSLRLEDDSYHVRVMCHGEESEAVVSRHDVMAHTLVDAWAFKPELPAPPPILSLSKDAKMECAT